MSSLGIKLEMVSDWGVGGAIILLFVTVMSPHPNFSTCLTVKLILYELFSNVI